MTTCSNCGQTFESGARFCPSCGTQILAVANAGDALIGRTLNGKYRVVAEVGEGSMGRVYTAEHISLKKRVALKVLHRDLELTEETLQRFQREGIALGKFTHPNAIQIFDFDRAEGGIFFLAMEFVEGVDLHEFLRQEGRLPVSRAVDLVAQILSALAEAHRHGIVHRDLKPENVMVVRGTGGDVAVKVLDFGLSKLVGLPMGSSLQTQPGRIMGTPLYMAPEQGTGEEVDHRSDLYAVGLILYELVTGELPFKGKTITELLMKQATQPVPALRESHPDLELPDALDDLIAKALAKRREDRFQTAEEMLAALDALELDAPLTASRPARKTQQRMRARGATPRGTQASAQRARAEAAPAGRPRWLPLAGIGVVALAVVGWFFFLRGGATAAPNVPRVSMKSVDARNPDERRYVDDLERARSSLLAGDTGAALAAVEAAQRATCRDSEAYLVRAQIYQARADADTAIADYRAALGLDASYAAAHAGIGWVELGRGDLQAAEQAFSAAAAADPASAEGLAGTGAVMRLRGDAARAEEALGKALALDADHALANLHRGRMLLDQGQPEKAVEAFVRAKRRDLRLVQAYSGLGTAYSRMGRREDAETQFKSALNLASGEPEALSGLATVLIESERFGEAVALLEPVMQRQGGAQDVALLYAAALSGAGRGAEAVRPLERAIAAGAADAQTHTLLGTLYLAEGRAQDAIARLESAIELDESLAQAHMNLGLALYQAGRHDTARTELEIALELDPNLAFAHYALGLLHMDYVGEPEKAVEHFRAYRALGGADTRVEGWLRTLEQ
jgi:serine/threonine-protein kinase